MVLPFKNNREIFRIDGCASQIIGRLLPIGVRISIQKMKRIVVKKPLIYPRKFAQDVNAALRNAERIIKYSVMFSAVTMPTN